jgi:hypothetical protein
MIRAGSTICCGQNEKLGLFTRPSNMKVVEYVAPLGFDGRRRLQEDEGRRDIFKKLDFKH